MKSKLLPVAILLATRFAQAAPVPESTGTCAACKTPSSRTAFFLQVANSSAKSESPLAWPEITSESRPWAYNWWMGSAVDEKNMTRELERYHDAGLGGIHIIPIYGAKGFEDRYLDYLSPKWMEMLRHTVTEAHRLGMGVDMTLGTGWCFGGPNVSDLDANALPVVKTFDVAAGARLAIKLDRATTQAVVAFAADGKCVELTNKIDSGGGIDFTASDGSWRVFAISQKPSGQKVKRPAPGGEWPMLNLIYTGAMMRFLRRFEEPFVGYDGPKPRAVYHDSYEYRSEWSPDFFEQFEKRRGYRLQAELPALFGKEEGDHAARVRADYRETVSDLIGESLSIWAKWSRQRGFLTRNEAHGSPGNLLDLYAVADMPETEMFHADRNQLVSKFASSAAHVAGRRLVSAETGTWLAEHFTETLAQLKGLFDEMFVSGVNHIFYHGTCWSPDDAPWPGWVFYASTEMNPRNAIWHDAPALNAYAARCQSVLQTGTPDNDILLYWPVHDVWHDAKGKLLPHFSVHARDWLEDQPVGKTARDLWQRGYTFDFVSDKQLASAQSENGGVVVPGGKYRTVLVPACDHIPLATISKLLALANDGAVIVFADRLPGGVPGFGDLEKRSAVFKLLIDSLKPAANADGKLQEARHGGGRVLIGDTGAALVSAGVARETMTDLAGVQFIRRAFAGGRHYFIANRGDKPFDGWMPLATVAASVALLDPMTGQAGVGALRQHDGRAEIFLQLQPGESVIVRTFSGEKLADAVPTLRVWDYFKPSNPAQSLEGNWRVQFPEGGPELPPPFETKQLASWTKLGGEKAESFAGTARYTLTFDAPATPTQRWFLDLGTVRESARVKLNGRELGTVFMPPFRVVVDALKPKDNVLEVEVTNVSANRIRDLDRRKVPWQNFHDINFVNIDYKKFDASTWPLTDSGLLGPVTLRPVEDFHPNDK